MYTSSSTDYAKKLFGFSWRLAVSLALVTVFVPAYKTFAQRGAVDSYAITGARIVTGQMIERGAVVIRNGLIAFGGGERRRTRRRA